MTITEICEIFGNERAKWANAFVLGLLDNECAQRIWDYLDHQRGLAVEWAVFIDGFDPKPRYQEEDPETIYRLVHNQTKLFDQEFVEPEYGHYTPRRDGPGLLGGLA